MSPVTSPPIFLASLTVIVLCFAGPGAAKADSGPDTENGRYTLSQTADGLVRLDTRTGAVSTCSNNGNGWACYTVPDERKAMDEAIGRLQAENERLKAELASREPGFGGDGPKSDKQATPKAEGERKIEIPLPSDQDVDRVVSFLEHAWRRLVDMANRMQKDASGKI